jgi:hypothetical protein
MYSFTFNIFSLNVRHEKVCSLCFGARGKEGIPQETRDGFTCSNRKGKRNEIKSNKVINRGR